MVSSRRTRKRSLAGVRYLNGKETTLPAVGFDLVFITGQEQGDIALGLDGEVAGSFGCASDDVDVATGIEPQVAAAFNA
jgi:hypothetical protein